MNNHMLHAGQSGAQLADYRASVDLLAAVSHTASSDQHFRLDLLKPV